jgi:hypothetical protein
MTEPGVVTASRAWEPGLRSISQPGVPLFMNVTLTINPERLEQFLVTLRDVLPAARAEPTCIYLILVDTCPPPPSSSCGTAGGPRCSSPASPTRRPSRPSRTG